METLAGVLVVLFIAACFLGALAVMLAALQAYLKLPADIPDASKGIGKRVENVLFDTFVL